MLYQIGLILIVVVLALIVGKKFQNTDGNKDQLVFEDEMTDEELKKLDEEID